jgi:hypothetical protein
LLLTARNHEDTLAAWAAPLMGADTLHLGLEAIFIGVPLAAAVLLWQISRQDWAPLQALEAQAAAAEAPATTPATAPA